MNLQQAIAAAAARSGTVRQFEAACRELGLPGREYRGPQSPARQIYAEVKAKQEQRAANRPGTSYTPDIRARVRAHLLALAREEVARRGLATLLRPTTLVDYDPKARVWLVGAEERIGSRTNSWLYEHQWLVGRDEGRLWAVRVPGTIASVAGGLAWLEPAEVKRAKAQGRGVIRQGDIYFIEMKRPGYENLDALAGTRHIYDPQTRTVTHPEHADVTIPDTWRGVKAVRQRALAPWRRHWRGGARVFGD